MTMEFEIYINGVPVAEFAIDMRELTNDQILRLSHHVTRVSPKVFEASVRGMLKGVQKYGPEPGFNIEAMDRLDPGPLAEIHNVADWWLPHIFSEGVDAANQTGLLADTLGVDVLP